MVRALWILHGFVNRSSVAFAGDGCHALSTSLDGTVRLWWLPDPESTKDKP